MMWKVLAFAVLLGVAAAEQPKTSDSPVTPPAVAPADGVPAGHRLVFKLARAKAASALAKKESISREAAREKIDDALDDGALHAAVEAAGIEIKPQVSGGKLSDFLSWLALHQDAIAAVVKIILALFGV